MQLPNYYLADLPREAKLSAQVVHEACVALRKNRALYLRDRGVAQIISTVCAVAQEWLNPESEFRRLAIAESELSGFSSGILMDGLDKYFGQITQTGLESLIQQDL